MRRSIIPCHVLIIAAVFLGTSAAATLASEPVRDDPLIGVDANYLLDMEARGRSWSVDTREVDPFRYFADNGCRSARIRLWVGDSGMNRLNYALETSRRARRAGLKPYLVLFLSEEWADFEKQPAPAAWRGLDLDAKANAAEVYAEEVVRRLSRDGIEFDLFELGNEIDFGLCGEFEEEWPKRVSLEYMKARVWPRVARLLRAAQAGVLRAQPRARFVVHLSQWNNVEYCLAFWRAMLDAGVRVDVPGLSYFPTSARDPAQRSFDFLKAQVTRIGEALDRPVLICETGYPARAAFGGQFASWNLAADGYPLNDDGQARWLRDLVDVVRADARFAGVFYWSPEWNEGGIWEAFSLFDDQGSARPSVRSLRP